MRPPSLARHVLLLGPGSKIMNPGLCERVSEFVVKQRDRAPTRVVSAGELVRRAIPSARLTNPALSNVIYSQPGADANRMDGITPMGPTRPALYTSLDTEAAGAEGIHYARQSPDRPIIQFAQIRERSSLWLPTKTIVTFKATQPILLLDIRRDNPDAMNFLKDMNQDPGVRAELGKAGYSHILQAIHNGGDYSASRGFAYAADQGLQLNGVIWNTARISQHADRFADNVSVNGAYRLPVPHLRPVLAQEYFKDPTSGDLVYVSKQIDPTVSISEVPPYPEGSELSGTV